MIRVGGDYQAQIPEFKPGELTQSKNIYKCRWSWTKNDEIREKISVLKETLEVSKGHSNGGRSGIADVVRNKGRLNDVIMERLEYGCRERKPLLTWLSPQIFFYFLSKCNWLVSHCDLTPKQEVVLLCWGSEGGEKMVTVVTPTSLISFSLISSSLISDSSLQIEDWAWPETL